MRQGARAAGWKASSTVAADSSAANGTAAAEDAADDAISIDSSSQKPGVGDGDVADEPDDLLVSDSSNRRLPLDYAIVQSIEALGLSSRVASIFRLMTLV